ncbi:REP-associated tyrosine transposase [Leptothoe sp. PORK10 BA2]|uniref:REP-associated tyrosine transposase n=1 Tax=Leptothoe sp. PORK10 BA2 TaxID=3110254 RepID=UPI002B1F46FA|nr:transposase [Leptothoe sp. PORK10 BA2]MEA5465830.1 transposase [Leptothoe sp. PORK10 BA2]
MQYRRATTPGATYFFTVVTYNRQRLFATDETIQLLRYAFHRVKQSHPFDIDAIVILPDHLHCLWTMPDGDADFSTRWRLIKTDFSRHCPELYKRRRSLSRYQKKEQAIWQRRFWEHQIRDERDFVRHVDYIHYNPVSHRLVSAPCDWPYSSFHRYVEQGVYSKDWGASEDLDLADGIGEE